MKWHVSEWSCFGSIRQYHTFCNIHASEALKILITGQSSHNAYNNIDCYSLYYSGLQHTELLVRRNQQSMHTHHCSMLAFQSALHNSSTTNTVSRK